MTASEVAIDGLRAFIKANATASPLTDAQVLREPYEGPRPNAPYIGVRWLSATATVTGIARSLSGANCVLSPRQIQRITLRITAYGAVAIEWLSTILLKLQDFGKALELDALGVGIEDISKQNAVALLDSSYEKREVYDFSVLSTESLDAAQSPTAPALQSVEVALSVYNEYIPAPLTLTIEAP